MPPADLAEQASASMCADGYEIRPGGGVVVTGEPDALSDRIARHCSPPSAHTTFGRGTACRAPTDFAVTAFATRSK